MKNFIYIEHNPFLNETICKTKNESDLDWCSIGLNTGLEKYINQSREFNSLEKEFFHFIDEHLFNNYGEFEIVFRGMKFNYDHLYEVANEAMKDDDELSISLVWESVVGINERSLELGKIISDLKTKYEHRINFKIEKQLDDLVNSNFDDVKKVEILKGIVYLLISEIDNEIETTKKSKCEKSIALDDFNVGLLTLTENMCNLAGIKSKISESVFDYIPTIDDSCNILKECIFTSYENINNQGYDFIGNENEENAKKKLRILESNVHNEINILINNLEDEFYRFQDNMKKRYMDLLNNFDVNFINSKKTTLFRSKNISFKNRIGSFGSVIGLGIGTLDKSEIQAVITGRTVSVFSIFSSSEEKELSNVNLNELFSKRKRIIGEFLVQLRKESYKILREIYTKNHSEFNDFITLGFDKELEMLSLIENEYQERIMKTKKEMILEDKNLDELEVSKKEIERIILL